MTDLGAKVSIINESLYKKFYLEYPISTPKQTLLSYDNGRINVLGVVYLPVKYQEEAIDSFPLYVTRQDTSLMGIDLFNQLSFKVTHNGTEIQTVEFAFKFPQAFGELGRSLSLFNALDSLLWSNQCPKS